MKVAFYTLGCKVNQYETNLLKERFEENNYEVVDTSQKADIYCINTCSVTNMSDRKTRQAINKVKTQNPMAIVAVLGCYAQSLKEKAEEINADCIIGNDNKNETFEIIEECVNKKKKKLNLIK